MNKRKSTFFADIFRFILIIGIVGACVYFLAWDKIQVWLATKDVKISAVIDVNKKEMDPNIQKSLNSSVYWKMLYKDLPELEKPYTIKMRFTEIDNTTDISTTKSYSPGKITVKLAIKDKTGKTVYKTRKDYVHHLRDKVFAKAGTKLDQTARNKAFKDELDNITKYFLDSYLNMAAVEIMAEHKTKSGQFGPMVIAALGEDKLVSNHALKMICKEYKGNKGLAADIKKLDIKTEKHVKENAQSALKCLNK